MLKHLLPFRPRYPLAQPAVFLVLDKTAGLSSPLCGSGEGPLWAQSGGPRPAPWIRRHRGATIALGSATRSCLRLPPGCKAIDAPCQLGLRTQQRRPHWLSCWSARRADYSRPAP